MHLVMELAEGGTFADAIKRSYPGTRNPRPETRNPRPET
jgi:hypothetical protein